MVLEIFPVFELMRVLAFTIMEGKWISKLARSGVDATP